MSEVTITPSQIPEFLRVAKKLRIALLLSGESGIGKTQEVTRWGIQNVENVKDVRLSQLDPVDLSGVPRVDERGRTVFAPPAFLPDPEIDGETGLFILDEFGDGSQATIVAAQQLILERRLGSYELPHNWHIVAMMNKREHGGVNRGLSYALQDRFMHATVVMDAAELITHFISKGVDPMITSFLKRHSNLIHNRPDAGGSWAWPSPRSWERLAMIRGTNPKDSIKFQLYASMVGEGASAEFIAHERVADQVPDPEDVIKKPKETKVPEDPSAMYAIAVALSHWMTVDNMSSIMEYLERLPSEYAVTSIMEARKIKPEIQETEAFSQWATDNVDIILG